jgi:hypothetical protein
MQLNDSSHLICPGGVAAILSYYKHLLRYLANKPLLQNRPALRCRNLDFRDVWAYLIIIPVAGLDAF